GEALRSLRTHLGVPLAAIISLDGESARLVAADGFFPRLDAIAISSDSLADLLRRTGEAIVVSDLSRETRFRTSLLLESMGARSGIAVPLRAGGGTIGGVAVGDTAARDYPVEDADFLQSVANVLSAAELRARQDEQLRESQSRQLEAAESVAASERFFRSMIENSMVSVAVVDAQSRYTYVSPNVLALLGYHHDELRGRSPFDFLHPDDTSTGHAAIEQACSAPGAVSFARVRFLHKDGSWRWIDASVRNLLHDDVVHGIVLNWHDVTERYQAEQALRQSEEKLRQAQKIEAIGRLAGGIAHDFNNLLTAILTTAQLSAMDVPEGSTLRADLGEIVQAGERAAALTRQLLAFSRRQVLRPRTVDLAVVLSDLKKMLSRLIGEDVELVAAAEQGCNVRADPSQLEQVIMNLALNARDAMPAGGRLTLRTGTIELLEGDGPRMFGCPIPRGSYIRLSVEDTGTGMDESTLQHIFEPFFTTKEMGKGTGLGLATVYGIVKQSGGYIRATSCVGKGSTFEIYLPETPEMADTATDRSAVATGSGKGETILLVEDEELVRVAARRALLHSGFQVLEATNGVHALKVYGVARVDLVITDLVMPEMGGRELATRLRQHDPDVKVLFTSGYTDDPTIRGGDTFAGISFLPKPFTPESLGRKAREVLDGGAPAGLRAV
ncbi:MAG TPA: PAS domain S-box protein, partial [Myxococcales bacterium]|nr:PAS domain S-box protein [Myxococcales bacterium]